ncbi:hypothetical protein HK102_002019 [Quaeritorhiza haematococci]|nr:hypothetical protein HK102_002019 [Quaeritorhiza haematococci]
MSFGSPMQQLPPETLLSIFQHLPEHQIIQNRSVPTAILVGSVCKSWRQISCRFLEFWSTYGHHVNTAYPRKVGPDDDNDYYVLLSSETQRLQKIKNINIDFSSPTCRSQEVLLSVLERIGAATKHGCGAVERITLHAAIPKTLYSPCNPVPQSSPFGFVINNSLVKLIGDEFSYISHLSLANEYPHVGLTDEGLVALAHRIKRGSLQHLLLARFPNITWTGLEALLLTQPNITSLKLSDIPSVCLELDRLATLCPHIENLDLCHVTCQGDLSNFAALRSIGFVGFDVNDVTGLEESSSLNGANATSDEQHDDRSRNQDFNILQALVTLPPCSTSLFHTVNLCIPLRSDETDQTAALQLLLPFLQQLPALQHLALSADLYAAELPDVLTIFNKHIRTLKIGLIGEVGEHAKHLETLTDVVVGLRELEAVNLEIRLENDDEESNRDAVASVIDNAMSCWESLAMRPVSIGWDFCL